MVYEYEASHELLIRAKEIREAIRLFNIAAANVVAAPTQYNESYRTAVAQLSFELSFLQLRLDKVDE